MNIENSSLRYSSQYIEFIRYRENKLREFFKDNN